MYIKSPNPISCRQRIRVRMLLGACFLWVKIIYENVNTLLASKINFWLKYLFVLVFVVFVVDDPHFDKMFKMVLIFIECLKWSSFSQFVFYLVNNGTLYRWYCLYYVALGCVTCIVHWFRYWFKRHHIKRQNKIRIARMRTILNIR